MKLLRCPVRLSLCLSLLASCAFARTWTVAKDGSGDFTVIQAAVNAASAGDSILIGPGRYTEKAPFTTPSGGWTEEVYVAILTDNLTLIGAGPDVTIIGPQTVEYVPPARPKGIVAGDIGDLTIESLTIENTRDGVYRWDGHLMMRECIVRACYAGVVAWTDGGMLVSDCGFIGNRGDGIRTIGPSTDVLVEDCLFRGNEGGVHFGNGTTDAVVARCDFEGGLVGVTFSVYSSGSVGDSTFENVANYAIVLGIASYAHLEGNHVAGGGTNLALEGGSRVTGTGNVLGGGTYATIDEILADDQFPFHGNQILHAAGGYSVRYGPGQTGNVDLTHNYWGTTDPAQIAEWIWDGNDDPSTWVIVDFEPFIGGPIPAESRTWGEVKDLYRSAK